MNLKLDSMEKFIVIMLFLYSLNISAQIHNNYPEGYVPENIESALQYLESVWTDENKEKFKNTEERDAVALLHFGTGLALRNGWGFWAKKRNSLVKELHSIGLTHPDDMSSFILTLFHRKLSSKGFNLKEEKQKCKAIQREKIRKERQFYENIKRKFDEYKVGDSIKVPLSVTMSGDKIYFGTYSNRTDWKISDFDCIIRGKIEKKSRKNGYVLTIRIVDVWFADDRYYDLNTTRKIGDVFLYEMKYSPIID